MIHYYFFDFSQKLKKKFKIFEFSKFLNISILQSVNWALLSKNVINKTFSPFQNQSMLEIWLWLEEFYHEYHCLKFTQLKGIFWKFSKNTVS